MAPITTVTHYICKFCGHIVAVKSMGHHLKVHHSNEKYKFSCGEANCVRVFSKKWKLIKHIKVTHQENSIPMDVDLDPECLSGHDDFVGEEASAGNGKPPDFAFNSLLSFVLYLYAMPCLPRKIARTIITKVWAYLMMPLLTDLLEKIDACQRPIIQESIGNYSNLLKSIDTEHKLLNILAAKGVFLPPKKVLLKASVEQTHKKGLPSVVTVHKLE
jgi:hypothetical protein